MQHVFVINPNAGKSSGKQAIYDMALALREKHNLDVQCILTRHQGHATELARKICESGEQVRFYACGGDGTINEVANGIAGFDNAAMTCIPIGTGNDTLKNFGDLAPLFHDAENLWDGDQCALDLIDVNGRQCLTIACSGLDARVAKDVHKYSESPLLNGKTSYVASLMVNFLFKGIPNHWTWELDGEAHDSDVALICCCNGRYYGGGFMPIPQAHMDDGIMDVLVVDAISRVKFASLVGKYSKGQWQKCGEVLHYYTPKILHITSENEDIVTCLDGEIITSNDVTIRISDKKLNFFGPKGFSPNATAAERIVE